MKTLMRCSRSALKHRPEVLFVGFWALNGCIFACLCYQHLNQWLPCTASIEVSSFPSCHYARLHTSSPFRSEKESIYKSFRSTYAGLSKANRNKILLQFKGSKVILFTFYLPLNAEKHGPQPLHDPVGHWPLQ